MFGCAAKAAERPGGTLSTGITAVCADMASRSDWVTGGERKLPSPTSTCGIRASVVLQPAKAAARPRLAIGLICLRIVPTVSARTSRRRMRRLQRRRALLDAQRSLQQDQPPARSSLPTEIIGRFPYADMKSSP